MTHFKLRCILDYHLQECSFPRKNCFNPDNMYSTSHTLLYLLHFSAFPSHVPELQKESVEPLQGQQAEYQVILWSVSVDAKHSAALHPTPKVRTMLNMFLFYCRNFRNLLIPVKANSITLVNLTKEHSIIDAISGIGIFFII